MEQSSPYSLGKKLREMRLNKKWTLNELSMRSGLSISHISSLERGTRTKPSMVVVRKLANALEVPVHHLHDESLGDQDLYSDADQILSRYAPETQSFLLQEESVPYVLFAKKLFDQKLNERGIIKALDEFLDNMDRSTK
ncbi:MAG: helix-turn-helix domain-containing protein [Tumebacillaceae bacterium]